MAIRAMRTALAVPAVLVLAAPLVLSGLSAQDTLPAQPGRIVGRVIDGGSGEPIPGAQVQLLTAAQFARADLTGRYTFLAVPPGTHTLVVRMIGYAEKSVTGVVVAPGGAVPLDITLNAAAIEVAGIEVTAAAERGSVANALEQQRAASNIVSGVSQEQIERSPDSDAGQAVQRVSGVTVQDGKYVLVRGLGERYTTTSLNNARIPSPEPERKIVPLDLFPSGLLQSIVTSKTFTPDQPGDFTGAQVDLRTREFPLGREMTMSVSAGLNDAATGKQMVRAPAVGTEWIGLPGSARDIPPLAVSGGDLSGFSQTQLNDLIGSFRNAWSAPLGTGLPNASFAASVGGEDMVAGHPLGYVGSLTYSFNQEARVAERRAVARYGGVPDSALPLDERVGSTGTGAVLWGGMLNLSSRLGGASRVSFNNTYTRGAENQATHLVGFNEQYGQVFDITQLTFTTRSMRSNQLSGEHLLGARNMVNWAFTSSGVTRDEPDRSAVAYETAADPVTGQPVPTRWFGAPRSAMRTFSTLDESSLEGSATVALRFGAVDRYTQLKVGGLYKHLNREADTRLYDFTNAGLADSQRAQQPEIIFDGAYASQSLLFATADAFAGRYTADDDLAAGFAQLEVPLGARVRLLGGVRVERWVLDMPVVSVGGSADTVVRRRNTDFLPALALNIRVAEAHTLRFSATQTLSRPEYREMSPLPYRDVIGGKDLVGEPDLRRALIQNLDARWEWYPNPGEIVSAGVFAKQFDDPIEKVFTATTGANQVTFLNAAGGRNYGIELEVRKQLISLSPALAPFTVFGNVTLMQSDIDLGNATLSPLTNDNRPMVGQSEYVVNAGLGYAAGNGLSATLLYNLTGPRITEAGTGGIPDAYEQARHVVDFSAQAPLGPRLRFKLDAKNLLDSWVDVRQGSVTTLRYLAGRTVSAGFTWHP